MRSHDLRDSVGTTSCDLLATRALPDTGRVTLDGVLSAEGAGVLGVLGDFHLLHTLSQGGTITGNTLALLLHIEAFTAAMRGWRQALRPRFGEQRECVEMADIDQEDDCSNWSPVRHP